MSSGSKILASIEKHVDALLPSRDGKAFVTFDFDNSCIVNDIGEATFAFLCKHQLLKDVSLLGRGTTSDGGEYHREVFVHYYDLLNQGKMLEAYLFCAQALSGQRVTEFEDLVRQAIVEEGPEPSEVELYGVKIAHGLVVRDQTVALMDALRARNINVWVVSASPAPAVKAAMDHWGISANLLGVQNKVADGIYAKDIEEPYPIVDGKVACIKRFINTEKRPVLAVGDSMNDFPMLEYAETRVVVRRGNALTKTAEERGWFLI